MDRHSVRWLLRLWGIIGLVAIIASPALAQPAVSVTAEVDRTTVSTDDLITLTVAVTGDFQQVSEPELGRLPEFDILGNSRSSQFSMVNGVVTARTVFTYRLRPTAPGDISIDRIRVVIDGSTYQTDPIAVVVYQGTTPTPTTSQGHSGPSTESAGRDLFVNGTVDNSMPFVGQQIIYYFRFYQAVNLVDRPRLAWPPFSGFWTESIAPNQTYEQQIDDRIYRVTEIRQALFPTTAGDITIDPVTLTMSGDPYTRETELKTDALTVKVRPLPQGAPENFSGAVGQYEISAWVEPGEAHVNDTLTLFVQVHGSGNVPALPDPTTPMAETLDDWRVYDPQITTHVEQDSDFIQGQKLIERLLVPKTEGALEIPGFALTFFDPQASEYRQVESAPLTVQVVAGPGNVPDAPLGSERQEIKLLKSDVRHIKAASPSLSTHSRPLMEQPGYWTAWILPPMVVLAVGIWHRRRQHIQRDVAYARAQQAFSQARKQLAEARRQAPVDRTAAFATISHAMIDYVGNKFNLSPAGLTHQAVQRVLKACSISGDLIQRTLACLDRADSSRFGPIRTETGVLDLIAEADAVIQELEKTIPKG